MGCTLKDSFQEYGISRKGYAVFCSCVHKSRASSVLTKDHNKIYGYFAMRKGRTNQRLPCVKGAVAKRLRDCFERKTNLLQSLRHANACHLPLHKGGFFYLPEGKQMGF